MSKRRRSRQSAAGVDPISLLSAALVTEAVSADPAKVELSASVREALGRFQRALDAAGEAVAAAVEARDDLGRCLAAASVLEAQAVAALVGAQLRRMDEASRR